jgi:hypothetical protein
MTNPPGADIRQTVALLIGGGGAIFTAMNLPRLTE